MVAPSCTRWGHPPDSGRVTCAAELHMLPLQKDTMLCGGSGVGDDTAAVADQAWHDQVKCVCSVKHGTGHHYYVDEN